jgi:hypothetical protein
MSKILQILSLRKDEFASGNYIVFRYGAIDFWIPERWIWYLQGSVEYRLFEDYIGRKYPKSHLKIYYDKQGKE